uniref:ATP synthase complex subunit 8 n=1 Tax=Cucujoidea sp. 34 KM-2017 TaxID=2219372 RepID=A0A346RHQ9_9CUCU|nr:ATP synthase F0 subunit 8 [Cucujoidea sp. 34 KM-2017]
MPQMMPMKWMTLALFFMTILIIYVILNYFCFTYPLPPSNKKKNHNIKFNWKW